MDYQLFFSGVAIVALAIGVYHTLAMAAITRNLDAIRRSLRKE